MKKLFAILMCTSLIFCASCGKKEEVKQEENLVEKAVEKIDKIIAEDSGNVPEDSIAKAKEEVKKIEEQLKGKVGNVPKDEAEDFQNQQVSVAIMQQALEALEKAQQAGDEEAIKEAQSMIEFAKSLWNYEEQE